MAELVVAVEAPVVGLVLAFDFRLMDKEKKNSKLLINVLSLHSI
jgi:hypothetical protein